MDLTLENLVKQAREEGWAVTQTTNVHLDRADWPAGTGVILVECFNEDGRPAYYLTGTEKADMVCIGGDKLNERPFASTVEGVMEWARYTWDSPDEPLPAIFLETEDQADWSPLDKAFAIAEDRISDQLHDVVSDWMVDQGWAERVNGGGKLELTTKGMKILEGGPPQPPRDWENGGGTDEHGGRGDR